MLQMRFNLSIIRVCGLAVALAFGFSVRPAFAQIPASNFSIDAEGWTVTGVTSFGWLPTGGNPGGFIGATPITLTDIHWVSPAKFHGNHLTNYNGGLQFQLNNNTSAHSFVLMSNNTISLIGDLSSVVGAGWAGSGIILNETSGWTHVGGGAVTQANFLAVISNIKALEIVSSAASGSPANGLDNVSFVAGPKLTMTAAPGINTGARAMRLTIILSMVTPSDLPVTVTTTDPASVMAPTTVTVPAGRSSVVVTMRTAAVSVPKVVRLDAAFGGKGATVNVKLLPAGPKSISLQPDTIQGGDVTHGTIGLDAPAGPVGINIFLKSADTTIATVPSSIFIPAGGISGTFTVTTVTRLADATVKITATAGSTVTTSNVTLNVLK